MEGLYPRTAFLLECLVFRFGLPYISIGAFCVCFTPVSFPLSGKERRLAICFVPVPPWVVIAIRAFSDVVRLSNLAGSLQACAFLYGDPDGSTTGVRLYEKKRRHCVGASFAMDL